MKTDLLLTISLLSTAICARWTMVGHHVCHGGYNSVQSENGVVTGRFHRRTFAKGIARRITDWMDWMTAARSGVNTRSMNSW